MRITLSHVLETTAINACRALPTIDRKLARLSARRGRSDADGVGSETLIGAALARAALAVAQVFAGTAADAINIDGIAWAADAIGEVGVRWAAKADGSVGAEGYRRCSRSARRRLCSSGSTRRSAPRQECNSGAEGSRRGEGYNERLDSLDKPWRGKNRGEFKQENKEVSTKTWGTKQTSEKNSSFIISD